MVKEFNFVYVTTNLINGKQYIGDHSTDNINDNYLGSGKYFLKAIKKYGRTNFKREILEQCNSKHAAIELQRPYINKYDTLAPKGYNISPAGGLGSGGIGIKLSEIHKNNIRKSLIGKNKGKRHSIEAKEKIRKAAKGRILTEETKQKMSKSAKEGMTSERKKKISESCKGRIPWNKGKKIKK